MAKKLNNTAAGSSSERMERQYMIGKSMSFAAAEAYKLLRTNLMFSLPAESKCRIIGMTSSFRSEGKSLTSINLAYSLAESRKKVLLIEGDMRIPTLAKRLRLSAYPGLSNLMAGLNSVSDTINVYQTEVEPEVFISFDVITSGNVPPNPSELLGSERMLTLLGKLRERYDYIILDLPPVTAVTDALVVSKLVDGMVVVVRNNHAIRGALAETIRQLRLVDTRILGFVFNGGVESSSRYYKGKYYKGKYYYKGAYYQK